MNGIRREETQFTSCAPCLNDEMIDKLNNEWKPQFNFLVPGDIPKRKHVRLFSLFSSFWSLGVCMKLLAKFRQLAIRVIMRNRCQRNSKKLKEFHATKQKKLSNH